MDTWKFFDITHRNHLICNPSSPETLDEIIRFLDLPASPRVLDIACGKGEFLVRLIEHYGRAGGEGVSAVAVDISPYVVADLRDKIADRVPLAEIDVLEMDAGAYRSEAESFDLAVCLGASWVYGGYAGTLEALSKAVKPGGLVLSGEPYWRREPDPAFLETDGFSRDEFGTHEANVRAGDAAGLVPMLAFPSSDREWDRYETTQWGATARYAADHPDDPDLPELLERVGKSRDSYLRWGRDTLGWAIYLFMRAA